MCFYSFVSSFTFHCNSVLLTYCIRGYLTWLYFTWLESIFWHNDTLPSPSTSNYYVPPVRMGAISVAFVRPSVCPSVAYITNNSTTKRPNVPKFGTKVPNLKCNSHTSFKDKRQSTDGGGIPCRPNPAAARLSIKKLLSSLSDATALSDVILWKPESNRRSQYRYISSCRRLGVLCIRRNVNINRREGVFKNVSNFIAAEMNVANATIVIFLFATCVVRCCYCSEFSGVTSIPTRRGTISSFPFPSSLLSPFPFFRFRFSLPHPSSPTPANSARSSRFPAGPGRAKLIIVLWYTFWW